MPNSTDNTIFELALAAQQKRAKAGKHRKPATRKPFYDHKLSARQTTGLQAEQQAIEYLETQGLKKVARNLSCRFGEIDAIMIDGNTLVFIEIRLRNHQQFGGAAASITPAKQKRLRASASIYLPLLSHRHFGGKTPFCRFDAVCMDHGQMEWIKHAF
ncbi:YraN family protein [Advenella sp. RU8]|uniref:YraN family protein n=1 Tax=Advenella sp. RU8 TaxID=3399575 RepID=UPI003AAE71EE